MASITNGRGLAIRRAIRAICLLLVVQGCDIAQERVYILAEADSQAFTFGAPATQANVVQALREFVESHGSSCRQHVKRWDEWSCAGPHDMRITFEPDRGKERFVAEFTLLLKSDDHADDFREYLDQFVGHMESKFPGAVLYASRLNALR